MVAPCADLSFTPRAHHITCAILIGAQKRAAAMHALFFGGLRRIERSVRPLRVAGDATQRRELLKIIGAVPVATPLPDVPSHVVESVTVRGKLRHRSNAGKTILAGVVHWK